jgi:hypothetical protein
LRDWQQPVVLRMARLDLVRGEWRRYRFSLDAAREMIPVDESDETSFAVNAVNLEENGGRVPVAYVMPPGIRRQVLLGNTSILQQNEQSLSLRTCGLRDGDGRAVFKNTSVDMRMNINTTSQFSSQISQSCCAACRRAAAICSSLAPRAFRSASRSSTTPPFAQYSAAAFSFLPAPQ